MSDFSAPQTIVTPPLVCTFSRYAESQGLRIIATGTGGLTAQTWVSGLAAYMPLMLPWPYLVSRVCWVNGTTTTTTNVDMGIYNADGVQLYHTGAVTMSGASTLQFAAVATPFVLPPGSYYLAWTCDNTTARGYATTLSLGAWQGRLAGLLEESSAYPLPATMTPVAWSRAWGATGCGITRTSSGH